MLAPIGLTPEASALYELLVASYALPLAGGRSVAEVAMSELIHAGLAIPVPEVFPDPLTRECSTRGLIPATRSDSRSPDVSRQH